MSSRGPSAAVLDGELLRQEIHDPSIGIFRVRALGEAVAFIRIHDVIHAAAEGAKALDDLVRFFLRHARVVLALEDEHRTAHVVDVRDRRPLDELRAIALQLADPSREKTPPVRLRVLEHGHEVRHTEDIDGTAPYVGYLRDAEQRRETAV